ncbi:MAG: nucleotidyltransferase domain-containing protein [Methanobacterium sp.]
MATINNNYGKNTIVSEKFTIEIKKMNNSTRLIRALIENEGQNISIAQLSKRSGMDYKNVYNSVKQLEKEGLLTLERFGNALNCILNKKIHPIIFEAEFERRKNLLTDKNLQILYKKLKSLNFSFIALIFGSYAKGTSSKGSDIDLMVIGEKNREKEIERIISLLPLNIHFVFLNYGEFLGMGRSKEFTVVSEAMKRNIILIGIEDYYRLIENMG